MVRMQVDLTEAQHAALERRAEATGRKPGALIREAVDGYLSESPAAAAQADWKAALEDVRGLWADRDDLDGFVRDLRSGWSRRMDRPGPT